MKTNPKNFSDLEIAIQDEAKKTFGKALSKNALKNGLEFLGAFFGRGGKGVESLGKIFLERGDIKDKEIQKEERKVVLKFLLDISESMNRFEEKLDKLSATGKTVYSGSIDVEVRNAKKAIGANVLKPTKFEPGTSIKLKASDVETAIGLNIG